MAEDSKNKRAEVEVPAEAPSWRTQWQLPALIAGVAVLLGGALTAVLTKPKPNVVRALDEAEVLMHAEKFEAALEVLQTKAIKYYRAGHLSPEQVREFHLLRARAIYLAEKAKGVELPENAKSVVEEYRVASEKGPIEPLDQFYLANAHIRLGEFGPAVDLSNALPPQSREQRGKIVKRVVEGLLAAPDLDSTLTLKLLGEFLGERALSVNDRGWALARQTELLLRQGLTSSAIMKVLQTLPGLMAELDRDQLGELYLYLGRAYFESDALSEAAKQLQMATSLLLPTDFRHAEALVLLGRIDEQTGDPPEEGRIQARAKFADVADRFANTPMRLPALLGLAEVDAAMGDTVASLEAYGDLVNEVAAGKQYRGVSHDAVMQSLMACANRKFDNGQFDRTLDYAALAERLYKPEDVPAEVLAITARAHRSSAEAMVRGEGSPRERLLELSQLDPATREQVRQHLIAAGRYFKRHADEITINDNAGFGRSLWMSAECYDLAGDRELAIPLYSDYAKFFKGERQQPEARFRLAQAHQARGDYSTAIDIYRGLIDDGAREGASSNVGPHGDASFVPLAQCYLADGDPGNDSQAEELLERVVSGQVGGPESSQFGEALRELGRLKFAKGDYAGAIGLLNEAATRFPEQLGSVTAGARLRFELAEAMRQDARAILTTLGEAMPEARRQALVAARKERLGRAASLYEEVRQALDGRDPQRMSRLEKLQLRNSYFAIADCEFELGNYEGAIRHYDAAREKYSGDPASLVAMVQIVNAYVEQGDMKRAATAQERAKRFYESLPVAAWQDPGLPMSQDDWKRWLQSMNALQPIKETGTASVAAEPPKASSDGH